MVCFVPKMKPSSTVSLCITAAVSFGERIFHNGNQLCCKQLGSCAVQHRVQMNSQSRAAPRSEPVTHCTGHSQLSLRTRGCTAPGEAVERLGAHRERPAHTEGSKGLQQQGSGQSGSGRDVQGFHQITPLAGPAWLFEISLG